jgi:hypothetical protein
VALAVDALESGHCGVVDAGSSDRRSAGHGEQGSMHESARPVRLAGSPLDRSRHVCAFFHTRDEEYQVLLPYVREGFEYGDRGFHIVDAGHRPEHLRRLAGSGIDVAATESTGQLVVLPWEDAYLRGGHFDQAAMLRLIEDVLQDGKARGFRLTRLLANMEWALQDRPGVDDIVEYETRLNYVLPKYDDAVV